MDGNCGYYRHGLLFLCMGIVVDVITMKLIALRCGAFLEHPKFEPDGGVYVLTASLSVACLAHRWIYLFYSCI